MCVCLPHLLILGGNTFIELEITIHRAYLSIPLVGSLPIYGCCRNLRCVTFVYVLEHLFNEANMCLIKYNSVEVTRLSQLLADLKL